MERLIWRRSLLKKSAIALGTVLPFPGKLFDTSEDNFPVILGAGFPVYSTFQLQIEYSGLSGDP